MLDEILLDQILFDISCHFLTLWQNCPLSSVFAMLCLNGNFDAIIWPLDFICFSFKIYMDAEVLLHFTLKYSCLIMEDNRKHASKLMTARRYLPLHPAWVISRAIYVALLWPSAMGTWISWCTVECPNFTEGFFVLSLSCQCIKYEMAVTKSLYF